LGEQIEENEMGGASSMYGRRGEVYTGFLLGNLRGKREATWKPQAQMGG